MSQVVEMMGAYEVAQELGRAQSNIHGLHRPAGMPEPVQRLRATQLWVADDIREFAKVYRARVSERETVARERASAREKKKVDRVKRQLKKKTAA